MSASIEKIKQVKRKYESSWLRLDGVVAVGIGTTSDGITGIIISVKGDAERFNKKIPSEVDNVLIEIKETGEIKAL